MHAPLVLFNWVLATWAGFGVGLDPSEILRVVLFLFVPLLKHEARAWNMVLFTALEAKGSAALALNDVFGCVRVSFDEEVTTLPRTPLDVSAVISELLTVPLQVLLQVVLFFSFAGFLGEHHHDRVRNNHVAPQLRTAGKHTRVTFFFYFDFDVASKAELTELVTAR